MKKANYFVYGGLFLISLLVILGLYFIINSPNQGSGPIAGNSEMNPTFAKSKMTEFDVQLAKKLMDKDNDGGCNYCGMNVDSCIDSGMMECTMNPEAKIGLLGSDHIHTDFKVYLNSQQVNFNDEKYFVKSAFANVGQEENSEETGNVLHIHAKGVPLWLFFESLGVEFGSNYFKLEDKELYNNATHKLRFFVNGIENSQFGNYVPGNLDKILISYGNESEISKQLDSITDYAKNH